MFDINELEGPDIILLRKSYALVNMLAHRDHMANFPWTVQLAEGTRAFHEVLEHAIEDGIKPAEFIAVHALAQCAVQMKDFPSSEHFDSLRDFLYSMTEEFISPEIRDHLREWADASHAEGAALAAAGPWAKLGAMTRSLDTLDSYSGFNAEFMAKHAGLVKEDIEMHRAIAAACKGLGPSLDAYYESRLREAERLLNPQPPAAPSAGAPGPQ